MLEKKMYISLYVKYNLENKKLPQKCKREAFPEINKLN